LTEALELARPGGVIRLFVDLGPPMARLLAELKPQGNGMEQYVAQILAAFPDLRFTTRALALPGGRSASVADAVPLGYLGLQEGEIVNPKSKIQNLIEPLTHREQDVLTLLAERLSDKEIARRLIISRNTVKTHTKAIFGKLNVKNRRQAVAQARELGLLSTK
jgi:LuxR family maltose regulon positive regulatory protein